MSLVLVVTQFMATLTDKQGDPLLLVKGGASLELRRGIPASRTSKDLDAVSRADIVTLHDRLADAGATGWEGFHRRVHVASAVRGARPDCEAPSLHGEAQLSRQTVLFSPRRSLGGRSRQR
ncbi:MAG: nucleotidyl transferase AbiEii/AbiGii toxin family protein [Mycobacteriales bacterium]